MHVEHCLWVDSGDSSMATCRPFCGSVALWSGSPGLPFTCRQSPLGQPESHKPAKALTFSFTKWLNES